MQAHNNNQADTQTQESLVAVYASYAGSSCLLGRSNDTYHNHFRIVYISASRRVAEPPARFRPDATVMPHGSDYGASRPCSESTRNAALPGLPGASERVSFDGAVTAAALARAILERPWRDLWGGNRARGLLGDYVATLDRLWNDYEACRDESIRTGMGRLWSDYGTTMEGLWGQTRP